MNMKLISGHGAANTISPDTSGAVSGDLDTARFGDRRGAELILREAGMSPGPLRERCPGEDDLYLAAYQLAMFAVFERAQAAAAGEGHWIAQIRASLRALLDALAGSPELAGACALVELSSAGRAGQATRGELLARLASLLSPGGGLAAGTAEAVSCRLLADGVLETIGRTVRATSPAALPDLLVQLHWWAVALHCT
jgi:AcrR family transcriptional regulator